MLLDFTAAHIATALPIAMLLAIGLVIGSYLNVVIYRLPAGISTVFPGSRCPRCLIPVKPWDNIPVLSYMALAAKCRFCKGTISPRYPAVELLTAVLFAASYVMFPNQLASMLVSCGLSACLVVLALIDWDQRQVPLALVITGLIVGMLGQPWLRWTSSIDSLIGALVGGGGLLLISYGWWFVKRSRGFEMGDVWVLAMIGGFFGLAGAATIFAGASVIALAVAAGQRFTRRGGTDEGVPFVTYLSICALWFHFVYRPIP